MKLDWKQGFRVVDGATVEVAESIITWDQMMEILDSITCPRCAQDATGAAGIKHAAIYLEHGHANENG